MLRTMQNNNYLTSLSSFFASSVNESKDSSLFLKKMGVKLGSSY